MHNVDISVVYEGTIQPISCSTGTFWLIFYVSWDIWQKSQESLHRVQTRSRNATNSVWLLYTSFELSPRTLVMSRNAPIHLPTWRSAGAWISENLLICDATTLWVRFLITLNESSIFSFWILRLLHVKDSQPEWILLHGVLLFSWFLAAHSWYTCCTKYIRSAKKWLT